MIAFGTVDFGLQRVDDHATVGQIRQRIGVRDFIGLYADGLQFDVLGLELAFGLLQFGPGSLQFCLEALNFIKVFLAQDAPSPLAGQRQETLDFDDS